MMQGHATRYTEKKLWNFSRPVQQFVLISF